MLLRSKEQILNEEPLTAEKRKHIPKSEFGYIDDEGKGHYPLNDETHVRSAITMFHYCPEKFKKTLAKNIKKAAKKFNIEIKNPQILNN